MIVEGTHLDPTFLRRMIEKYGPQCLCYVTVITEKNLHIKRFTFDKDKVRFNPDNNRNEKLYSKIVKL